MLIDDFESFDIEERNLDMEDRKRFDVFADEWILRRRGRLTYITSMARATGPLGRHYGSTLKTSDHLRS